MKRNSTYIAFVLAGALLGERVSYVVSCGLQQHHSLNASIWLQVVNYGFDKAWEQNNQGVSNPCMQATCALSP